MSAQFQPFISRAVCLNPDIPAMTKLLLVLLRALQSYQTGHCKVTQARLAHVSGMSRNTIKRHLDALHELGMIDWKREGQVYAVTFRPTQPLQLSRAGL